MVLRRLHLDDGAACRRRRGLGGCYAIRVLRRPHLDEAAVQMRAVQILNPIAATTGPPLTSVQAWPRRRTKSFFLLDS